MKIDVVLDEKGLAYPIPIVKMRNEMKALMIGDVVSSISDRS